MLAHFGTSQQVLNYLHSIPRDTTLGDIKKATLEAAKEKTLQDHYTTNEVVGE